MSLLIKGIEIGNFRGFNSKQKIELSKAKNITFIIGPNNSGKSLISRALSNFRYKLPEGYPTRFSVNEINDTDFHNLNVEENIVISLDINKEFFRDTIDPDLNKLNGLQDLYLIFLIHKCGNNNYIGSIMLKVGDVQSHRIEVNEQILEVNFNSPFKLMTNLDDEQANAISKKLYLIIQGSLQVFDPIRSFDREGGDNLTVSGMEIIKWLDDEGNAAEKRRAREKVKEWLKKDFNLEAPTTVRPNLAKKELIFSFDDGLELSTRDIGTGYTMIYILLMEIVRSKKKLIIIDEIESHLQPALIRQLMKIIKGHGDTQFIVSTHSSTVLETASAEDYLYRTRKIERECTVSGFYRRSEQNPNGSQIAREVCNELGVVPGDALLSNCVIWVEGPSEVFWVRTWLKNYIEILRGNGSLNFSILEGLHYSILMTGGSSISHYSFGEDEYDIQLIEEDRLIKVLRVNPNPFVILDSDNAAEGSMKAIRQIRIAEELNEQNRLHPLLREQVIDVDKISEMSFLIPNYWRLGARELENYAHPQLLKDFYLEKSKHGNSIITGVESCNNWDVYHATQGAGTILESQGVTNVSKRGAIKHKDDLARYIFKHFEPKHLLKDPINVLKPNHDMIEDLISGLEKIVNYIKVVNSL